MSGPTKRLHEEGGGHPATPKHAVEDGNSVHSHLPAKLAQSASNDYLPPVEAGSDSRLVKSSRSESRDADRRSPLHSMYRMTSSSNDSIVDHQVNLETRMENRDSKENKDSKIENRDGKVDARDSHNEPRVDPQIATSENFLRFESRGDDNKEVKHDRDSHVDFKGEAKFENDAYSMGSSHSNWKESKEQQRGKRFPESSAERMDARCLSLHNAHGTNEVVKDSTVEEKGFSEANETIGENKVDLKGDDRLKDKERKKKDEKHRDWGEREKDRNERRSNLQFGTGGSEQKDITREDRESEKWKEAQKEKERPKDREKDHIKKETVNATEKDDFHNEKELADESARITEQESPAVEQRRHKEFEGRKSVDRDAKDKKRERDVDVEGDKLEKRNRIYDKESDDGYVEGNGSTEREREGFGYGVQQRKRMLRPRGSPQVANREPCFRSHSRDNEESQDKPAPSTVVYKVGESMDELIQMWKEFEAFEDKGGEIGPILEVRIRAEYVSATNRQVRGGQLWGTDIYTDDSDLVAVFMHTGYCRPTALPPPSAIEELRATIRILPPQDCYVSTLRNNVRSRAWGAGIGCSYRVEGCRILKKGGGSIDLEPCLTHSLTIEPTLAPMAVERTITTRAAASNALRQQRYVREVTIQYNLVNEPWIKYSISMVADKGLKKPQYTSARLKKGEVLYLETHSRRYELCFNGERMVSAMATSQPQEVEIEKSQNRNSHEHNGDIVDVFRWSRCKMPLPQNIMQSIGIPLLLEHIEVLEENVNWEDVQWTQTGAIIAGKEYAFARVHFMSPN